MHFSLHVGGLLMFVKMFGGLCAPPEKLWRICLLPLNASNYITIILHSVCLACLSSHCEKLGQSDLDKKINIKIFRKRT